MGGRDRSSDRKTEPRKAERKKKKKGRDSSGSSVDRWGRHGQVEREMKRDQADHTAAVNKGPDLETKGLPDSSQTGVSTSRPPTSGIVNRHLYEEDTYEDEEGVVRQKELPNFESSGILATEDVWEKQQALRLGGGLTKQDFRSDLNSVSALSAGGKVSLPPDAAVPPPTRWRIYIFQQGVAEATKTAYLAKKADFLFGKDRKMNPDIAIDHPSCSKQHAVIHFRKRSDGEVCPYILDLDSTNGTMLSGQRCEPRRYYELKHQDVIRFASSSRDYVLMRTL